MLSSRPSHQPQCSEDFIGWKVPGYLTLGPVLSWHSSWLGDFGGPLMSSLCTIYDVKHMVFPGVSQCESLYRWSLVLTFLPVVSSTPFHLLRFVFFAFVSH